MSRYNHCFLLTLGFVVSLGAFLFGYDISGIGAANLFVHYDIQPYTDEDKELVTSIVTVGAGVGALFGGSFSDRYGRKPLIILSDIMFLAGASTLALARSVGVLVLGRIIVGLGVGMSTSVGTVYLSEISPTPIRGMTVTLYQLSITGGCFLAYIICYLLGRSWRIMFGLAIIPALIQFIGMFFMPESPRWFLKYSRQEEAMKSFSRIYNLQEYQAETELEFEIEEIKKGLREEGNLSYFQQLKGLLSNYYKAVIIGNMLFVIQQFSGITSILYYGPNIILDAGFGSQQTGIRKERQALLYSFILFSIKIISIVASLFLIDRKGRRYLMLRTLPFMGLSMLLLAFAFYLINIRHQVWAHWITLASLGIYLLLFSLGMGSTPYAVNGQIYPLPLRATANSLAITTHWISNFTVAAVFLSATKTNLGQVLTFSVLGLCCLLGTLFIYKFVPETKGLPLPQIVRIFRPNREEEPDEQDEQVQVLVERNQLPEKE